jgi:hypothetical protein
LYAAGDTIIIALFAGGERYILLYMLRRHEHADPRRQPAPALAIQQERSVRRHGVTPYIILLDISWCLRAYMLVLQSDAYRSEAEVLLPTLVLPPSH